MTARTLALAGVLWALASPAIAQTVLSVDITKAKLSWQWSQGPAGPASEFRVKCGAASGAYTKTTVLVDPAARTAPVLSVIAGPGKWFCAVSAANPYGESGSSNEVTFDAGSVPVAPTNATITAQ